jgi:hypothetical protein
MTGTPPLLVLEAVALFESINITNLLVNVELREDLSWRTDSRCVALRALHRLNRSDKTSSAQALYGSHPCKPASVLRFLRIGPH